VVTAVDTHLESSLTPPPVAPVSSFQTTSMLADARRAYRIPWGELLKKVSAIDVLRRAP
jgi:hypothetical protein